MQFFFNQDFFFFFLGEKIELPYFFYFNDFKILNIVNRTPLQWKKFSLTKFHNSSPNLKEGNGKPPKFTIVSERLLRSGYIQSFRQRLESSMAHEEEAKSKLHIYIYIYTIYI